MKTGPAVRRRKAVASAGPAKFRADHLSALRNLLAGRDDVREGRMFGHPAFFVGRRMFACVYGDGVGIKVPASVAARLLERADTEPFRPYGKPSMREWVQINRASSGDYGGDLDVLLVSIDFVARARKRERSS